MSAARSIVICGALLVLPLAAIVLLRGGTEAKRHLAVSTGSERAPAAPAVVPGTDEPVAQGRPQTVENAANAPRPVSATRVPAPSVAPPVERGQAMEKFVHPPRELDEGSEGDSEPAAVAAMGIDRLKGADLSAFSRVRPQSTPPRP